MISITNESTHTALTVGCASNQRKLTTMNDLTPVLTPAQEEIWKPVVGYEGIYEISNIARVKAMTKVNRYFPGRILKPIRNRDGYLLANLYKNMASRIFMIHRLVAYAFIGDAPTPSHEINHKNGIKTDNRVENLEWVTRSQNIKHAFGLGLCKRSGSPHPSAKLNWTQVREIRQLVSSGVTRRELSELYCVTRQTIGSIIQNVSWRE